MLHVILLCVVASKTQTISVVGMSVVVEELIVLLLQKA